MKILSEQDIREKFSQTAEKQSDDTQATLRDFCMKLLVRRDYSVQELYDKAQMKAMDMTLFTEVLEQLQQAGFQSDERFCEAFIRSRVRKRMGPVKIKMELRQKGIGEAVSRQVFQQLGVDWFVMASALAQKKQQPLPEGADFETRQKAKAKLMRFLQSRGFEAEQISFALSECQL